MIWLVGAGVMAQDYWKVLKGLGREATVIGRSEKSTEEFQKATGAPALAGGLEKFLAGKPAPATHAIVSVSREELAGASCRLLEYGVKNVLVEKPAGLTLAEVESIRDRARGAKVVIGFNRRFYSSVQEARRLQREDGGAQSFNFEFTEWAHKLEPLVPVKGARVMETWFLGNSIHVADLAFFLGGYPTEICTFTGGGLEWHPKASVFAGAGVSERGALFSYQANWESAGRWSVEVNTKNRRLILRPLEELQAQARGSVQVEKLPVDDRLDKEYKPGLYLQTKAFLEGDFSQFCDIHTLARYFPQYLRMAGYA